MVALPITQEETSLMNYYYLELDLTLYYIKVVTMMLSTCATLLSTTENQTASPLAEHSQPLQQTYPSDNITITSVVVSFSI
jgi:hypothetical protein